MPLFFYQKQKTSQTGWKGKMEQNKTREEEIKQAVRMATQLERTRVLADLEKWLDNTPDAFDEISKQSLRAKLAQMKGEK